MAKFPGRLQFGEVRPLSKSLNLSALDLTGVFRPHLSLRETCPTVCLPACQPASIRASPRLPRALRLPSREVGSNQRHKGEGEIPSPEETRQRLVPLTAPDLNLGLPSLCSTLSC